jgi:hypothetical protein
MEFAGLYKMLRAGERPYTDVKIEHGDGVKVRLRFPLLLPRNKKWTPEYLAEMAMEHGVKVRTRDGEKDTKASFEGEMAGEVVRAVLGITPQN